MKTRVLILLSSLLILPQLHAQHEQEAIEFLKSQIQQTARERDEARKRLLEAESLSAAKVKLLSSEQAGLQQRLNQTSRSLLELEASTRMSKAAMKRTEQELQQREEQLEKLRLEQDQALEKFEQVTAELNRKLEEAELKSLDTTGPEGERLAAEREKLRSEIEKRDQQLANVEAARQRDLNELHELQQVNSQLQNDLNESRRSEALANAKLAALESSLGSLQQELTQQYQERSELEQEQEKLQGVIKDLQARLDEAEATRVPREQFDEISETLAAALAENRALKDELSRREDIPDLRHDYAKIQKERDALLEREEDLVNKVENLEEKLERVGDDAVALRGENKQLQRQLKEEQRMRERLEKDIEKLQSVMDEAKKAGIQEKDLESVALLVAEMEREKEALREEALNHRKNVDLIQAELDNQKSLQQVQIRELQNMLSQQLLEITVAQKKINALEAKSSTLDQVRKQKAQLVLNQEKSRQDMRILAKHIYELRSEVVANKETQRKAILALQKNQELANELSKTRKEMEKLQRQNSAIAEQTGEQDDRIRRLRIELEAGRSRAEALEREKRQLLLQLNALQNQASGE